MIKRRTSRRLSALLFASLFASAFAVHLFAQQPEALKSSDIIMLTAEEKEYIEDNPVVTIAVDTSWIPYSMYNSSADAYEGTIPNILTLICGRLGLHASFVGRDSYMEALSTVKSGETILVSGIADDDEMMKKNGVLRTKPYITISYSAVTKKGVGDLYAKGSDHKAAVCVGSYSTMAMKRNMPTYKFTEYNSNEECMKAVSDGDVDTALVAAYAAEYYKGLHRFSDLTSVPINNFSWGLCFGVNSSADPRLISILNKGIDSLDENDVNQAIYSSLIDAANSRMTLFDWALEHFEVTCAIIAATMLLLSVLVFMILRHKGNKKKLEEQRVLNEKLVRANNAKQEFMSRMSHELRTPMNAIIGSTALALDSPELSGEMKTYFEQIDSAGKYLLGVVNDILDADYMESNELLLEPEWVRPWQVLSAAVDMMMPEYKSKGVALILHYGEDSNDDIEIFVDVVRCRQIFTNLLSNSLKFTPPGGIVSVLSENVRTDGDILIKRLTISDTGVGMSEEFQKVMFEPFSQEHCDVTAGIQGTGLGLCVVRRITEQMNGSIELTSRRNNGTTAVVTLPLKFRNCENLSGKQVDESIDEILKGKTVLLAEDHPLNASIAVKLLEKKKMNVVLAQNGLLAVNAFGNAPPGSFDCVLMDIRMPKMNGIEAARAIRSMDASDAKTVPIIAMTANAYDSDREESRRAGMNAHLAKPIDPDELYRTIARCLKERGKE